MREMKRAIHIDFHTMPGIEDFGKNINVTEIVDALQDANANYVNFFGRCNKGFSYYPTKIGISYPGLKSNLLKDIIDECHKRDIGVTAYLNGCFSHEIIIRHPEFAKIGKDGTRIVFKPEEDMHAYQQGCFNTGYRAHLLEEIKEMLEYDPDGIFVDCLIPYKCYCPNCISKMKELGMNPEDEQAVADFQLDVLYEVCQDIRDIVPKDKWLFYNSIPFDALTDYLSHVELECLAGGGWGYEYYRSQAMYFRDLSENRLYMSGRFIESWGDFGGWQKIASIENDIFDALLYGYRPSVGDHMHPRDGLNRKMYKEIGKIYRYLEKLEPWLDVVKPFAEVGVLRNKITYKNVNSFLKESDKGVSRMLCELKINYNTINEDADFSKYKLLILPDYIEITDVLYEKLQNFKGAVLSTGRSIREGGIWNYIDEFSEDCNTHGFYCWGDDTYGMYDCAMKLKSQYSIADHIEPYYNEGFDGNHYYFYVPPKKCDGYAAVVKKGNYAHICFDIFKAYNKRSAFFHKELVNDLISMLMPNRKVECDLPSTSRVTVSEGIQGDLLQIKVTYPEIRESRGVIEEHNCIPSGRSMVIDGEYKEVKVLPDMHNVNFECKNGKIYISLPEICGYLPIWLVK